MTTRNFFSVRDYRYILEIVTHHMRHPFRQKKGGEALCQQEKSKLNHVHLNASFLTLVPLSVSIFPFLQHGIYLHSPSPSALSSIRPEKPRFIIQIRYRIQSLRPVSLQDSQSLFSLLCYPLASSCVPGWIRFRCFGIVRVGRLAVLLILARTGLLVTLSWAGFCHFVLLLGQDFAEVFWEQSF